VLCDQIPAIDMTKEATLNGNPLTRTAQQQDRAASPSGIDLGKAPVEQVPAALGVGPDQGLGSAEAQKRLAQYGSNAIVEKEQGLLAHTLSTNQHSAVIPAWIAGIQGPGRHSDHHIPVFWVPPFPRIESGAGSSGTTRYL
jgi:hypothetical protein